LPLLLLLVCGLFPAWDSAKPPAGRDADEAAAGIILGAAVGLSAAAAGPAAALPASSACGCV